MRGLLRQSFERVTGPPAGPRLIADGVVVTDDAVWAWAQIPPAATSLLEDDDVAAATWSMAAALTEVLPPGAPFHLRVLWTGLDGVDAMRGWASTPDRAPRMQDYAHLGATRIDRNVLAGLFRRRLVLLGVAIAAEPSAGVGDVGGGPLTAARPGRMPIGVALQRLLRRAITSPTARERVAHERFEGDRDRAQAWLDMVARSGLRGEPVPARTLAWLYGREFRPGLTTPESLDLPTAANQTAGAAGAAANAGPAAVDAPVNAPEAGGGDTASARVVAGVPRDASDGSWSAIDLITLGHGTVDPSHHPRRLTVVDSVGGGGTQHVAILVAAVNGFPGDGLPVPGGEWLALAADVPGVEVSVRGVQHGQAGSIALLDEGRKATRSQTREAGEHSTQVPLELLHADDVLNARRLEVQRRDDVLVTTHARWIVRADTLSRLDERVARLRQRYAGIVRLEVVPHVQDLLWAESLPGDRVRVPEFAQHHPMRTLAGGWPHGGSPIGDRTGPYVGANLGPDRDPVRLHLVSRAESDRARPTTVSFTGQSGSGKSTALMLTLLGALAENAWCLLVDPKGDLRGLTEVASQVLGVTVQDVEVLSPAASGVMDPMRFCASADEARPLVLDSVLGALSPDDRRRGEAMVEAAVDTVLRWPRETWSAQRVIHELLTTPRGHRHADVAVDLGSTLSLRSKQSALRPVLGPLARDAVALRTEPGLVRLGFAGLDLPRHETDPDRWTISQRCAVTLFRTSLAFALGMSRRARHAKKVVALTELHAITGQPEGRAMVEWLARTGRALQTWLLLDTQSAVDLATIDGLPEQTVMALAFRATGDVEQTAQSTLLGRPAPGPRLRATLSGLGVGQCVIRDRRGRLGAIEFDRLDSWIAATLATDPPTHADPHADPGADPVAALETDLRSTGNGASAAPATPEAPGDVDHTADEAAEHRGAS